MKTLITFVGITLITVFIEGRTYEDTKNTGVYKGTPRLYVQKVWIGKGKDIRVSTQKQSCKE